MGPTHFNGKIITIHTNNCSVYQEFTIVIGQ